MTDTFDFADMMAIIGLFQSLYLLVYIAFRAGEVRHVIVPFLCFFILSLAFTADFATPRFLDLDALRHIAWLIVPVSSVMLIAQVADFGQLPKKIYWVLFFLNILILMGTHVLFHHTDITLTIGNIMGCLSFLVLWASRKSFADLREDKLTKGERYWLIVSVVIMNVMIIFASLLNLSDFIPDHTFLMIRDVLGIGMVYLASTSLLRIYPRAIQLVERQSNPKQLSASDNEIIEKIRNLFDLDKVYQEANFSRADMARELNISEANVSRLVSAHFGKSLPQIVNDLRIQDSLQLLRQTDAPIAVVAEQVGFSSLPTFNRVFKDSMSMSPSEYRQNQKK